MRHCARGLLVLPLSLLYLTLGGATKAEEAEDWACIVTDDAEEVCGTGERNAPPRAPTAPRRWAHVLASMLLPCSVSAASFDSNSDMVCVEDYSSGKLRWVCT